MTGPQQVGDSTCMVWKNVCDLLPREVTRRNEGIAGGGGQVIQVKSASLAMDRWVWSA